MKIDLPLTAPHREQDSVVQAEIVDVAPHLWGTFAVHRCPWRKRWWQVSHVETGCRAGPEKPTKDSAVRSCTARLRNQTNEVMEKQIQRNAYWRPDVYPPNVTVPL